MIFRGIERSEVVEVFFDFRPVGNVETDRVKDGLNACNGECDGVKPACTQPAARKRDINRLLGMTRLELGARNLGLARIDQRFHRLLGYIQLSASRRLLFA